MSHRVGWSAGDTGLDLGETPLSYGYGCTGKAVVNNQYNEYGEPYGDGDVITCLLVSCLLSMICSLISLSHTHTHTHTHTHSLSLSLSLPQDLESSPPSISFARNGNHLGIAFTLDENKVKGQCFFPHISVKNVMVRMNFCEVRE